MSTSIEKVKAYHSIKCFLDDNQKQIVADMLGLEQVDTTTRIKGKDNEIEFLLMIYLLEWCESIVGFEEGVSKLTDSVSSDFLVIMKDGTRLVIEVKSTEKRRIKISRNLILQKQEFAESVNAKLYFAVKIKSYWMLLDSDYILNQDRKLTLEEDLSKSMFTDIFGERVFIFPKGLKLTSIYDNDAKKHLNIHNSDYGPLIRYKLEYNGQKIFTVNSYLHNDYAMIFLYENLQDFMSIQHQEIKIDGRKTIVIEELVDDNSMMYLSSFLMAPIKHLISEANGVLDYHQFLMNLIDGDKNFIKRHHILSSFAFLVKRGYDIYENRKEGIYSFRDMLE